MNKQIDNKAIEEMAKIIANKMCYAFIDGTCSLNGSACDLICRQGDEYKEVAEAFYNAGYCKVDEEKYKKYLATKSIETNLIEIEKDKSRKETAREILQELSKMRTYGTKGDFLYKIDKLAEKHGVEVE